MAEELTVCEPADRFATMSRRGEARIWLIDSDGIPQIDVGADPPTKAMIHDVARAWAEGYEACQGTGHDPINEPHNPYRGAE